MRAPALLALLALLIGGASVVMQGPLPGDAAIAGALQDLFGPAPGWAFALTETAKAPLLWATLALAGALAWLAAGGRWALAVPVAYALAFAADKALRAAIFVPRPAEPLLAVAEAASSSGLPSTFGLVYGAMFGVAALAPGWTRARAPLRLAALALLLVGCAARVVLGGHWPSQMLASASLGLALAGLALAIVAATARLSAGRRA